MVKGIFTCFPKRKSGILPFSQRLSEGTVRFLELLALSIRNRFFARRW